jgi:hypothetical protein
MKLKASTDFAYYIKYPTPIITILRPRTDLEQRVLADEMRISPHVDILQYFDMFGNACQRMIWQQGEVKIHTETIVEVQSEVDKNQTADYILVENLPSEVIQFLLPSRYCLSDTQPIINLSYQIIEHT